MHTKQVDVAILGAGTAGLSARREVETRGRTYALIDRGPLGTTCARVGCMPSKLLIAAAEAAHHARHARRFGVHVGDIQIDQGAVLDRVRSERDRFVGFVVESVDNLPPESVVRGSARFVAPTVLQIDDHTRVEAKAVVLAPGSSPWIPPELEAVREHVLVNDDVFELPRLPTSLAVLGTGVIGLELGQALQRLGVQVTFLSPFRRLVGLTDPVVHEEALRAFGDELTLELETQGLNARPDPQGGVQLRFEREGKPRELRVDKVLAAAGRRPNLGGLGLETLGVKLNERGVPAFDPRTMQLADQPVFIAGDANGHLTILHEAADEGRIAGANAATYPETLAHIRRTPLGIVFTDPQVATVGVRFADLCPEETVIGEVSYRDQGRARVMGKNVGHVRIYARRDSGTLLGAEMIGPSVEHTAHLLAWAVQQQLSIQAALRMPFYHPVVEEGIRTALRHAGDQLKVIPKPCAHELDCGPGA